MAKYFIVPTNGPELEIDGNDFMKLKRRFKTATSGAWEVEGEINTGAIIQLQNIIAVLPRMGKEEAKTAAEAKKKEKAELKKKQLASHPELKKPEKTDFDKCKKGHAVNTTTRRFPEQVVVRKETTPAGVIRYFPVCPDCKWKGQLIKAATIPKTFDMQPEQVPDYEG